jgi:hypothetical protein
MIRPDEKHGMSRTRTYRIWQRMKQRCLDVNYVDYPDYGAKGVTIFEPWIDSFVAFYADVGDIPDGMEIDRIDTTKGYAPGNIRFATRRQQMENTRRSKWWIVDGVSYSSATAASQALNISKSQIKRMCNGYMHHETKNWIPPKEGCSCERKYKEAA